MHFELESKKVYELGLILRNLTESLGELPKLSTNPKLKALIERKKDMQSLDDEMYALQSKQNGHLTPEQSEKYYQKVAALFKERLEEYYKMNPEKKETQVIGGTLYKIVYDNPRLSEIVVEIANTTEKMKVWDVGYSRAAYLHGTLKAHKEKLEKAIINKNSTLKTHIERMSEEHKENLKKLTVAGVLRRNAPKTFFEYYKKLSKDALYEYTEFLGSKEAKKILERNPKLLISFTKACQGMNSSQFEAYSNLWLDKADYEKSSKLKKYERIIKDYEKPIETQFALFFLRATTNRTKVRKLIKRTNKLVSSGKIDWTRLVRTLKKHPYKSDKFLTWCEKLDKEYIDKQIIWFTEELSYLDLKEQHLRALNSLTTLQRKVFDYLQRESVHCSMPSMQRLEEILETAKTIKTEDQIQYIFEQSYKADSTLRTIRGEKFKFPPSERQLIELSEKASKYPKLWEKISKFPPQGKVKKLDTEAYSLIDFLINKSIPDEQLTKLANNLKNINYRNQVFAITMLFTPNNLEKLLKEVAASKTQYSEIHFNSDLSDLHSDFIRLKPTPKEIPAFLNKLIVIKKNKKDLRKFGLAPNMALKAKTPQELHKLIEYIEDPKTITTLKPIYKSKEYPDIEDLTFTINVYFYFAVSIDELKDPQKILPGLKSFLAKANKAKYSSKTDPNRERAKSFLDDEKTLKKEDNSFTHIAFILNVLQGSSPKFTKEKLQAWSLQNLNSPKQKLREKAAKLLIGTGTYTSKLKIEDISKIAKETVDGKISKFTISDDVTADQLKYINEKKVQLPLSTYFSMLINMEQQVKQKNQALFEKLVNKYKEIENKPVYHKQLLIIAHDKNDKTHSYIHDQDSFSPRAHKTIAKVAGAKVLTLRHASENESVESMLSRLELTEGNLDIVIGGHGGKNVISFGREYFNMNKLFERLAKRLEREKGGKTWNTQVVFSSCISSYNIELLMEKWKKDPRTKNHSVRMLSSSSEEKGSAKMADDSWFLKAKEIEASGRVLTWGELYRDIESRNFVMDLYGRGNSNMTLYENGERYF